MTNQPTKTKGKNTDNWGTPQPVYAYFNDRYDFVMDIAASKENSKHERFLSVENSAFDFDFSTIERHSSLWCNPPYSDIQPWVELARKNADDHGLATVMLLKHDCSTRWYKELLHCADEIIEVIGGRLPHQCYKTGKRRGGGNFPSMFAVFYLPIHRKPPNTNDPKRTYIERDSLMNYSNLNKKG